MLNDEDLNANCYFDKRRCRSTSLLWCIYISTYSLCQSILHVTDFNNRNKFLTNKLLKQGYRYHKLRKAFSKFYRRHFELIENIMSVWKKRMQQGICNPEFYGDLVYKFRGADNSFYRPAPAILTVTDQNDSRHNVKTVLPIINTLILLENDKQLLSQS